MESWKCAVKVSVQKNGDFFSGLFHWRF